MQELVVAYRRSIFQNRLLLSRYKSQPTRIGLKLVQFLGLLSNSLDSLKHFWHQYRFIDTPFAPLGLKTVCSQCIYRHSAPLGLLLLVPEILFLQVTFPEETQ